MKLLWRKKDADMESDKREIPNSLAFSIAGLEFNEKTSLAVNPDELVVLVGPNNVGKTATLRGIQRKLRKQDLGEADKVLREVTVAKSGNGADVTKWLDRHYTISPTYGWYEGWGGRVSLHRVNDAWADKNSLGDLTDFFCRFVSTEQRLDASRPADNLDVLTEPCQRPLQILAANLAVEKQLSDACNQAFGVPLFLDRWSGKRIGIRCGGRPQTQPWTLEFLRQVRDTTPLELQGDGMRSFVGCILEGVLAPHMVVLLDEPEAFLHPQHARILGRMLASARPTNRQLFIATHSVHLLLGLLDFSADKIRVVRIRRDGEFNPTRELRQDQIKDVWQDSLLRASNVLEGLFHEQVVICEGDADCRFYSCVLEAIAGDDPSTRRPDVMFTSCGGKARMPLVIRALKALDVPVRTIVDFDVLQNGRDLQTIVEAYGHKWDVIEPQWKRVNEALRGVAPPLSLAQVRSEVLHSLDDAKGPYLDEKTRGTLFDCLKTASPWAAAKRGGMSSLPSGEPTAAYIDLRDKLSVIGIAIVDCGELERFVPSIGAHGPKWVAEVLQKDLRNDNELKEARDFVCKAIGILRASPSRE